jgi:hypothetical protein
MKVLDATVGFAGAALLILFGWLYWKVVSSPGDDNPIGLL